MNRTVQVALLTLVGALLVRIVLEGVHVRYVKDWFGIPLLITGAILLVLAVVTALRVAGPPAAEGADAHGAHDAHDDERAAGHEAHDGHDHDRTPLTTWLLFLPVILVFTVSPPALGSYLAERLDSAPLDEPAVVLAPLPEGDPVSLSVGQFTAYAVYDEDATMRGRSIALEGFVSLDEEGRWYLTRVSLNCCAADAYVRKVRVDDAAAPPRDTWVRVVGEWVEPAGQAPLPQDEPPGVRALSVVEIEPPASPYE